MAGNGERDGAAADSGEHEGQDGQRDQGGRGPDDRDLRMWDREVGGYGGWHQGVPESQPRLGPLPSRRTKTTYFVMMGTCLGLCIVAWVVVAQYSTIAAVIMSAVALVIPPLASIIANATSATDRRAR